MKSIPFLRAQPAQSCHRRRQTLLRRRRLLPLASTEVLEPRWMLSTTSTSVPAIQMISATTADSKSVTIDYNVNQAPAATNAIQFGIYRSSDGKFDSSDTLVDTFTPSLPGGVAAVTLDQTG